MPRFKKDFVKCDRCGETYEDTHTGPTTMWLNFQSFNIEDGHHDFRNGTITYYLCAKCEKDFFNWFLKKETKTGHWIESAGDDKCSVCGAIYRDLYPDYQNTHYCPNCGAKMIVQEVKWDEQ